MDFPADHETPIRLAAFGGVFLLMASLEAFFPRKKRTGARSRRWATNGALIIDTMALRFLLPILAVGAADVAAGEGWGLLNRIDAPVWLEIFVAVVALDMLIYLQHVASHKIPFLWRLQKIHHADRDIDVTTGARFHPIEITLSMVFKIICVMALGASAAAVFLFEVILNASAMFNHANVRLPLWLDRALRTLIVTPDLHRVHHSVRVRETDSNYGFCLSIWDRLFGTFIAQPHDGHDAMTIGLAEQQDERPSTPICSLTAPFTLLGGQAKKRPSVEDA